MNKTLLSAALIACFSIAALAPQIAHAAPDGTITFTGKVVNQTCVFKVNGGGASNTVVLPVVFASALTTAGSVAGNTPFTIGVTGCDTNLTSVQALFSGLNIQPSGNLGGAGNPVNVQVQLLNGATPMNLSAATASAQSSPTGTLASGATTLSYAAQYIAVGGAAGTGLVNTSVAYTMTYQ